MAFTTKRGRPSSKPITPKQDLGTPELIKKRLYDVTQEALDLCLLKNLIDAQQHWCGIHLRWLYTLRYGVPSVKALDPENLGGRQVSSDNPEWRKEREKEYHDALEAMSNPICIHAVLRLCVFNQRPSFLKAHTSASIKQAQRKEAFHSHELRSIKEGLDALVKLWCKHSNQEKKDNASDR